MAQNWRSWGMKSVELFKYQVNKTVVSASNYSTVRILYEGNTVIDIPTAELNGSLPRYHGYSIGGKSRGKFVFINYGRTTDLNILMKLNITFCGSNVIPIVRLGFSDRAAKVRQLKSFCANDLPGGLLVYPDPWDYAVDSNNKSSNPDNTRVYPDTWWLPGDAAVFGSMKMKSGLQSQDLPSLDGIFNTINFTQMLTPFPVQPISYNDAKKLFEFMNGTPVPKSWGNCLPSYLESKDKYEVEMVITNTVAVRTLVNVIGHIPGSTEKDRYVILGNHRDAWVYGASDPGSGTVILQQVASILIAAYKKGEFRPKRSVIFANWDGEEEGLLGSTEFTSQFGSDLSQRCIAYVNMDCPIKGNWSFVGRSTPLLIGPMLDSARNVYITPGYTLFDDWKMKNPRLPNKIEPKVNFLGGGSDHNLFAYVLGIPSAYPEYSYNQSLASMPAYHTKYDNIDMMTRIVDPQLQHHAIVSKFVIDYIIRLSCSAIVPYSVHRLSDLLLDQFPGLETAINTIPLLRQSNYSALIYKQLLEFNNTVALFTTLLQTKGSEYTANSLKLRSLNDLLMQLPRIFITRDGLPTRPYLRNILLATRLKNSYLGSVFTGVYDAIELHKMGKVTLQVVLRQVSLLSDCLRQSIGLLKGGFIKIF